MEDISRVPETTRQMYGHLCRYLSAMGQEVGNDDAVLSSLCDVNSRLSARGWQGPQSALSSMLPVIAGTFVLLRGELNRTSIDDDEGDRAIGVGTLAACQFVSYAFLGAEIGYPRASFVPRRGDPEERYRFWGDCTRLSIRHGAELLALNAESGRYAKTVIELMSF